MSEPICIEVADYNDPDKKATADAYATMYDIDLTECFRLVVGARSVWVWVWDDDGDFLARAILRAALGGTDHE